MSEVPPTLQQTAQTFLEVLNGIDHLNGELKGLRKTKSKCIREIKKYMKANNIPSMKIGDKTFNFEQNEKLVLSIDRVERSFPASQVEKFKQENTEIKTSFTYS